MAKGLLGHIDFHVHTIHSNCGKAEMYPSHVARIFESMGYIAIGFTDHYDPLLTPEKIRQTQEELDETDIEMSVFLGTEACVFLPDWPRWKLRSFVRRHLDFCILSPSHRPTSSDGAAFSRMPLEVQSQRILDAFIEAVEADFADVVAHPFAYATSQIAHRDEVLDGMDDYDLTWALETARENEIAMEFSPRVLGLNERFLARFYSLCKDIGVRFSVGGDAHSPNSIGNDRLVMPLLSKFGVEEGDIWFPQKSR